MCREAEVRCTGSQIPWCQYEALSDRANASVRLDPDDNLLSKRATLIVHGFEYVAPKITSS
jgi:hypothetical protein